LYVYVSSQRCQEIIIQVILHCGSKKFTRVACYNFDIHEPILIIFGRCVTEKVRNDALFFPSHLTSASALPGETGNRETASFHLYAAGSFANKHTKYTKTSRRHSCQN